ncbi:Calx-beta domain-containing protein [Sungkyunkwania multivorans]|uniref:Calx-beta domain-containing protein n=1 Tax=Sungkyunkwania multivorans TaxID=1173618 RepID=A0ABW3D2G9_9FLAO
MKKFTLPLLLLIHVLCLSNDSSLPQLGMDGTVSINDVSKLEGAPGLNLYIFTVTFDGNGSNASPFSVDYSTIDDSATAPSDYAAAAATLNFSGTDGQSLNILIFASGDFNLEPDEQFFVQLSNIQTTNGEDITFADAQGIGTLTNDDGAELTVTSIGNSQEVDGLEGNFRLSVSSVLASPITVNFTMGGDAIEGTDYTTIGTSVIFPANTFNLEIPVTIISDDLVETDELVIMTLTGTSNPQVVVGSASEATVMIIDDDDRPFVNVDQIFGVDEDALNNTLIGTVLATDFDLGTTFSDWMIVSGNTDTDSDTNLPFAIDPNSGELTVNDTDDITGGAQFILGITVTDGTNTSIPETVIVDVNTTLSVEDGEELTEIAIYPNPSSGLFYVKGLEEDALIQISNITGSIITSELYPLGRQDAMVDLSNMSPGIYFLTISTAKATMSKRIIKN